MILLYRALNKYDILANVENNGFASKKLMYDITKNYCDSFYKNELLKLSFKEKNLFYKNHMEEYLKIHNYKLNKLYEKRHEVIRKILEGTKKMDSTSTIELFNILSTLNNHLVNGSKVMTNWISTTKSLNVIDKYYSNQQNHFVAVIASDIKKITDRDFLIGVDLSKKDEIENNYFLVNKIDTSLFDYFKELSEINPKAYMGYLNSFASHTNNNFMGFNFATASKEVAFYDYIPPTHILGVVDSLQFDLMKLNIFNYKYFTLDKKIQLKVAIEFKQKLLNLIKYQNDPYLLYLFEILYLENKNENNAIFIPETKDKVEYGKRKILMLSKNISSKQIKN